MATMLSEIEDRLLSVMPTESTIDRAVHARAVAFVVIEARRKAVAETREQIAVTRSRVDTTDELIAMTRSHVDTRDELIRLLKNRMREHGE